MKTMNIMSGPGSLGNIIAALCSVFVPGLGQLVQGRILKAAFLFVTASVLWLFMLGWLVHIWAIWDAAVWRPPVYLVKNQIRFKHAKSNMLYQSIRTPADTISL